MIGGIRGHFLALLLCSHTFEQSPFFLKISAARIRKNTLESRYNELLYNNEVLGITNDILRESEE